MTVRITITGPEGSGKGNLVDAITDWLKANGYEAAYSTAKEREENRYFLLADSEDGFMTLLNKGKE